jgi:uncharacterized protein (DUF2164 family)
MTERIRGGENPMGIKLSDDRRRAILGSLNRLYQDEFDAELSSFQAERILQFFLERLGPSVYNQAVQDARGFMQGRLDDLDAEFYEPEIDV